MKESIKDNGSLGWIQISMSSSVQVFTGLKLKEGLEARGFVQSQVDPYVWCRDEMIILLYVGDFLMLSTSKDKLMMYMLSYRQIYILKMMGRSISI